MTKKTLKRYWLGLVVSSSARKSYATLPSVQNNHIPHYQQCKKQSFPTLLSVLKNHVSHYHQFQKIMSHITISWKKKIFQCPGLPSVQKKKIMPHTTISSKKCPALPSVQKKFISLSMFSAKKKKNHPTVRSVQKKNHTPQYDQCKKNSYPTLPSMQKKKIFHTPRWPI